MVRGKNPPKAESFSLCNSYVIFLHVCDYIHILSDKITTS
ncbi:hypothetical protein STN0717ENT56_39090 [Enterobacter bugandensis]|nr:hypothetical protein STN0717ENT56_39090 [Enterobacter bugandensis]